MFFVASLPEADEQIHDPLLDTAAAFVVSYSAKSQKAKGKSKK
jgi:hypothetical protein